VTHDGPSLACGTRRRHASDSSAGRRPPSASLGARAGERRAAATMTG
jgi:hypothetical protein